MSSGDMTLTIELRRPWYVKMMVLCLVPLWCLGIKTPRRLNGWVVGLCLLRIIGNPKWRRVGKPYAHSIAKTWSRTSDFQLYVDGNLMED